MFRKIPECVHLVNDYLCLNNRIGNNGFYALSDDALSYVLHHLVPFERPDMYAVLDDKLVLLEHFAFDASKHSRKGMHGFRNESEIHEKMNQLNPGEELLVKTDYSVSIQDWQDNFNRIFSSHYTKIDDYIDNVKLQVENPSEKEIVTGFFVENPFPPYLNIGRKIYDIPYIFTTQFQSKFIESPKLDFLLYGCYYNGKPQIFYADKKSWEKIENLIDLSDPNVTLSGLKANEVVWGCHF